MKCKKYPFSNSCGCELRLNDLGGGGDEPVGKSSSQAIDLIQRNQHGIFLILTIESYSTKRREEIEGWMYMEPLSNEFFAVYGNDQQVCLACRGTNPAEKVDVWNDALLSFTGGCNYPRVGEAKNIINSIKESFPNRQIVTTGHSLGGGVARCLAEDSSIIGVTFNPACPPLAPAPKVGSNVTSYHIVFDFVSAWMGGGGEIIYRLDMGYRPKNNTYIETIYSLTGPPHTYDNFMGGKSYRLISASEENDLWQNWFNRDAIESFKKHYKTAKRTSLLISDPWNFTAIMLTPLTIIPGA